MITKSAKLFVVQMLFIVLTASLIRAGEKWDFIELENTSVQAVLLPSKDTISATDTLIVRVTILNTGGLNLILADIWEDDSQNVSFSYTDEQGQDINFLSEIPGYNVFHCIKIRNPWASSLILGPGQFWGFTLEFFGRTFPKSGTYYFQVTYRGASPGFIKGLIESRRIERSKVEAPFNKYWHGEVKSNKIKIVVKKE